MEKYGYCKLVAFKCTQYGNWGSHGKLITVFEYAWEPFMEGLAQTEMGKYVFKIKTTLSMFGKVSVN